METILVYSTLKKPIRTKSIFISECVEDKEKIKIVSRKVEIINEEKIITLYPTVLRYKNIDSKKREDTLKALKKLNSLFKD